MDQQTNIRPSLWLVRHGQSTWNALGWRQGQSDDARLTFRGMRQVQDAVDSLSTGGVEVVYSSDLRRALQTASIIAGRLGCHLVTDKRLREQSFGRAEGSPSTELKPQMSGIVDGLVIDAHTHAPGGESLLDLYVRCSDFLDWLAAQHHRGDVVLVAHGGSIRMLRASLTRSRIAGMTWDAVDNASASRHTLPGPPATSWPDTSPIPRNGSEQ
jgi:broad specificity phosphatase PhoE